MKSFLNVLYEITVSIGQARAASALARAGKLEEARALMVK
jgi:hypothetical protein